MKSSQLTKRYPSNIYLYAMTELSFINQLGITDIFNQPWRNDMPGIGVSQRPAHLFLTIKGAGNIEGSPEPAATLHALHVIQTAPAGGFSAWIDFHLFSKPGDRDFVWRPKDDSLVDPDQPFFTTQLGRYGVIEVSAHNGPRFEGYGLKYVIIAEMGDGVLLKSTEQVIEMSS